MKVPQLFFLEGELNTLMETMALHFGMNDADSNNLMDDY